MSGATKTRRKRSPGPRVEGGSRDARKVAMLVLEVLGGARTPTEAAQALGVSTGRYYGLEAQALEGLLKACEPRSRGRQRTAETTIAALEKKVAKLEKECARRQALQRLSQRAVGVKASAASKPKSSRPKGKRRRKRPTVRALKAAAQLDADGSAGDQGSAE